MKKYSLLHYNLWGHLSQNIIFHTFMYSIIHSSSFISLHSFLIVLFQYHWRLKTNKWCGIYILKKAFSDKSPSLWDLHSAFRWAVSYFFRFCLSWRKFVSPFAPRSLLFILCDQILEAFLTTINNWSLISLCSCYFICISSTVLVAW